MFVSSEIKVSLITLGCSKNLVDAECMITILQNEGFVISDDINEANVIVINTCGFIEDAKKEAIDAILNAADYKKPNGNADFIVVTGCLPQRYPKEILEEMPEVDIVLGTSHYKDIATAVKSLYTSSDYKTCYHSEAGGIDHLTEDKYISTQGFAWLKIGEGCRNCCTFCAIPLIRGKYVSRPEEDILKEAQIIASKGYKEIILAAQDTTNYGIDFDGKRRLPELLRKLSLIDGIETIRVMYGYMDGIDDELINEMKTNKKVAHYLDIPIQHGDNAVLKSMNRRDTAEKITEVITKLRKEIPDIIIRTTVMVGFPGEDDKAFANLIDNLKLWKFDRLGCFIFSPEEGTFAYKMPNHVDMKIKEDRYNAVYEIQREISRELNAARVGTCVRVTIDSISDDGIFYKGRSYGEAPEVDPEIYVISQTGELTVGESYDVKIVDSSDYELTGVTYELT